MRSILLAALASLTLAACQHRPTIQYPKLTEAGAIEQGFDCAKLDDAILKTEAVRWVMREDGARLLTMNERVARTSTDFATAAAGVMGCWFCIPPGLGDEGHAALERADKRLLSLLALKKAKSCPARPTAIAQTSDLDIYDRLRFVLDPKSAAPQGRTPSQLIQERMELLDGLRPPTNVSATATR